MDFIVTIGVRGYATNDPQIFEQFYDAIEYITRETAQWNADNPDKVLEVTIAKVPNSTPTLGIIASEAVGVEEKLYG